MLLHNTNIGKSHFNIGVTEPDGLRDHNEDMVFNTEILNGRNIILLIIY